MRGQIGPGLNNSSQVGVRQDAGYMLGYMRLPVIVGSLGA
jgi:hypothetical protein